MQHLRWNALNDEKKLPLIGTTRSRGTVLKGGQDKRAVIEKTTSKLKSKRIKTASDQ